MPSKSNGSWLRSPSNWISLAAVIISAITFFLVYANPGKILVIPSDTVGIALYKGYFSLAAPLTFTNTGAPRTVQHIIKVTAKVDAKTSTGEKTAEMYWLFERAFVGRREYLAKYPELKTESDHDPDDMDYFNFENRTAPFALFGGTSESKVLQFGQETGSESPFEALEAFEVTFHVTTDSSSYGTGNVHYICQNPRPLREKSYKWCHAKNL